MTPSDPLYGLSGTLWPIHLKPLPDELLSSWIVRLSHAHGYKSQTMCRILFGRNRAIWNRDIDRLAPSEVGEILVKITGATVDQFERSTLRAYEGSLFERHNPNGMTRWLVPLGICHRTRKRPGLMFCLQCLRDDAEPYFRRRWRLAFSTVCTKHKCHLLDACPKCTSPLAPHRADMQGRKCFTPAGLNVHCWKCGFDLRNCKVTEMPDDSLIRIQMLLEHALDHGYLDWSDNHAMHSLVFFDGVRELITGITSRQTLVRLKKQGDSNFVNLAGWPRMGLEMASLPMRRNLFQSLAVVLDNWPENFVDLIRNRGLRYSDLKGDSEQRAFWYEDVICHEAAGGYAQISQEEADAIADAVEVRYGRFSGAAARELSGRDIDAYVADRRPQPVSEEVYEDLMTSIDHQIAGTLNKMERACLIRDKVMFAVGRRLRLSEGGLADLTIERVKEIVPEVEKLSFVDVARTPAQARAWVEWYWSKVRPQLQPVPSLDCVFTSPKTRRGLRHSAINNRFQRVVAAAMLRRSVNSYRCWVVN